MTMFTEQIDTKKGLVYMAGKKEIYVKIANLFLKEMDAKAEELNQFFQAGDFENLTIRIHGLKSSAASLGATVFPQFAQELENAGKAHNEALIREKFDAFVEQYKDTCGALAQVVATL